MSRRQAGDAFIGTLVVIIVIAVGVLAFILWRQLSPVAVAPNPPTSAVDDKTVCSDTEKLCFTYPANWSVVLTTTIIDEIASDKVVVKNQAGATTLILQTGITGVGGACDPRMESTLSVLKVDPTKITTTVSVPDAQTTEVYAVQSIYYDPDKGYAPFITLTQDKIGATIGTTKQCLPELMALFASRLNIGLIAFGNGRAFNEDPLSPQNQFSFKPTRDQAEAVLASSDTAQTCKILLSAHYQ